MTGLLVWGEEYIGWLVGKKKKIKTGQKQQTQRSRKKEEESIASRIIGKGKGGNRAFSDR